MVRVVRDWEIDERGEYFCYFDPYPAQREAEGELTAAQANVVMFTPYLRLLHRRWYSKSGGVICSLREFLDFLRGE
jgi:hypothetical protein